MASPRDLTLYNLTIVPPTSRHAFVEGSFTGPRQQELITASNCMLELHRLRPKDAKLYPVFRTNLFASIRNISSFRLPATKRDFLIVTSDAGTLTILSADESKSTFTKVHCEPLGKSGVRRSVEGQFIASDPRGRACMVAALERRKLCFVLNRDAEENLTISSALEAHKSNTVTFDIVGVDVGFENPMFASLERSYELNAPKQLVYYELDLGLNHVTRKAAVDVPGSTSLILAVPGHNDGPGGVLLMSDTCATYRNILARDEETKTLDCAMPYRKGTQGKTTMPTAATVYQDRKSRAFFFLVCTEKGDLIKCDIAWDSVRGVTELRAVFFDSLLAPATSMAIFRSGFLGLAMEGGDFALLRFQNVDVGDDDPSGGFSVSQDNRSSGSHKSQVQRENGNGLHAHVDEKDTDAWKKLSPKLAFQPRDSLQNLSQAELHRGLNSTLGIQVTQDDRGYPLMLAARGRGRCAELCSLRCGVTLVDASEEVLLPFRAQNVFTIKSQVESKVHRFIILSSLAKSLVLEVAEGEIQESSFSGFEQNSVTHYAGLMSTSSLVQVHAMGVRFLPNGILDDSQEWKPPHSSVITAAQGNLAQLIVLLSSNSLIYFEIDEESGALQETDVVQNVFGARAHPDTANVQTKETTGTPCLALQDTPPGRKKASFFAAADGTSSRARLFKITHSSAIEQLGLQIAPGSVNSLALVDFGSHMGTASIRRPSSKQEKIKQGKGGARDGYTPMMYLVLGTIDGMVSRVALDAETGDMSGKRTEFLGLSPIRSEVRYMNGTALCLLFGSKAALLCRQGEGVMSLPMLTSAISCGAELSSQKLSNGIVAVHGSKLRLVSFDSTNFSSSSFARQRSLPPASLPSKSILDFSLSVSRKRLLSAPRRILQISKTTRTGHVQSTKHESSSAEEEAQLFLSLESKRLEHGSANEKPGQPFVSELSGSDGISTELNELEILRWSSKIQLFAVGGEMARKNSLSPTTSEPGSDFLTLDSIELATSDRILTGASCAFSSSRKSTASNPYVIVSVLRNDTDAANRVKNERDSQGTGVLITYEVDCQSMKLICVHETVLFTPAYALTEFRDLVAVGCGSSLQLYSLGKSKLLKKAECKVAATSNVVALSVTGKDRIFVADVQSSVKVFKYGQSEYNQRENEERFRHSYGAKFIAIAADTIPRWIVSMIPLDYSSVCCSDKFGNVFVLRVPTQSSTVDIHAMNANGSQHDIMQTSSHEGVGKLLTEASTHLGSTVVALTLTPVLFPAHPSNRHQDHPHRSIVYVTLDGSLGIIKPLRQRNDSLFAVKLEAELRNLDPSLCGRDQISYRSSFSPVKNIIDGDLCEMFESLTWEKKTEIARKLGRSESDIRQKLEELRSSML